MPSAHRPSKTLRAASRCPLTGILDRRFAAGRRALIAEGRSPPPTRFFYLGNRSKAARSWGRVSLVSSPAEELGDRSDHRHALVINRRQDRPADQDLAACVALALRMTRACDEAILLGPQTGEAFVERLNSGEDSFRLRHGSPPTTTG